jgi:hypothetical protein
MSKIKFFSVMTAVCGLTIGQANAGLLEESSNLSAPASQNAVDLKPISELIPSMSTIDSIIARHDWSSEQNASDAKKNASTQRKADAVVESANQPMVTTDAGLTATPAAASMVSLPSLPNESVFNSPIAFLGMASFAIGILGLVAKLAVEMNSSGGRRYARAI